MSTRPVRALAVLTTLLAATACSGAHRTGAGASTTTVPPGTITADHWSPPVLTGPPSESDFCTALTAIYRHMADLPHVLSKSVSEQYLADYVAYTPTVEAQAPAGIRPSATTYMSAVAAYLQKLNAAGLQLGRLPPGALQGLASAQVNGAYTKLAGYSTNNCNYMIGGDVGG